MQIIIDELSDPRVHALLQEHLAGMYANSPAASVHALDLTGLQAPDITFWTAWEGEVLLGCGALKQLEPAHGEIKSMRTAAAHLRKGVAQRMLAHILHTAQQRGYQRLSLETGSSAAFLPALALYESFGFSRCGPFAHYREDPFSIFMSKQLQTESPSATVLPQYKGHPA
ncbi:histone acetyltransferase HPA2 [Aquitalea magnusonii]|jgi:putative acetyltransferase|uniref:Histone acetyltransferase HPA2 n=1 Tax=Aquitalea magnusonii TaxID=332411 RepID=A0A3G9GFX0_9NEIS|nr:GNAT family N-acetyltransferase [Aquitalea magnusonii]BBF85002.1 histone acetyltransferase HPA2 [Aquitalea magnusonii]